MPFRGGLSFCFYAFPDASKQDQKSVQWTDFPAEALRTFAGNAPGPREEARISAPVLDAQLRPVREAPDIERRRIDQRFLADRHVGNEAARAGTDADGVYSFWDYQAGAWQKNNGIRIDHLMLSPEAASRLVAADVEKHVRAWEKPSDHVPVTVTLSI